jgi:hypothetical protein
MAPAPTAHLTPSLAPAPAPAPEWINGLAPGAQERHGRVHANGLLAPRQLALGHLDAACATWTLFLDDYEQASSVRGDEHFETMRARVRGFRSSPVVRDLQARAHAVAVGKGVAA